MKLDLYGQPIYSSDELVELLYKNPDIELSNFIVADPSLYNSAVKGFHLEYPKLKEYRKLDMSLDMFDKINQDNWFMPENYSKLDIDSYIKNLCKTQLELERVELELTLFEKFNLKKLLQYIIYLVDVMRDNQIVWGVGRGSSVASYILYLIGLHKVNSLKYNLDINEFLR